MTRIIADMKNDGIPEIICINHNLLHFVEPVVQ